MSRAITIFLLLVLCGCMSQRHRLPNDRAAWLPPYLLMAATNAVHPLPHRTAQQLAPPPEDWGTANSAQVSRSLVVQPLKPLFLVWEQSDSNYLCDIWSTTNLTQPFTPRFLVSGFTNAVAFYPANQQEYFIARFIDVRNWMSGEWSHQ